MPQTRQLRLTGQDQIRKRVNEFLSKKINIVLKDNRVMTGEVTDVLDTGITVKNMRLKKMHFPFHEITEIYFDTLT
jgi:hypothetical protein